MSETPPPQPPMRQRPTADLIVFSLTGIVGFVIVVSIVGGVIWKITDPNANVVDLAQRIGDLVNTLIGAIVGYLAGRGTASALKPPPDPHE